MFRGLEAGLAVTYVNWGLFAFIVLLAAREAIRRRSRLPGYALVAALFLWSWPPAAALFAYSLEGWYPVTPFPTGDAEAIVVLGGAVYGPDPSHPEAAPAYDTLVRCQRAAWLYRNWKALPVVASGGEASNYAGVAIAEVMRQTLIQDGVPDAMIWTEDHSRSTYENALFSSRLLRDKQIRRVALVTEAYHLPRSVQCFRKQGLDVVPVGCNCRYLKFKARFTQFFPSAQMILFNEDSLHEWVGFAWYRLSGKA